MLEEDPTLTPRDIIVMVADIDSYSPFIQAVFGSAPADRYLPYAISDRRARQSHPVLGAFISLLSLPDSRFVSEDVLALLDVPVLAARFDITEEGLRYLRQWVNESGIRWGIDDDNVRELELPATGQHTWRFGLTRMLLGYAMESAQGEWQSVLPYDESSGLIAELVGHLASLLMQLNIWRRGLAPARPRPTLTVARMPLGLASDSWHQGVIGIAASRLGEEFHRPTIMICCDGERGKGSCRSFGGFNLDNARSACSE